MKINECGFTRNNFCGIFDSDGNLVALGNLETKRTYEIKEVEEIIPIGFEGAKIVKIGKIEMPKELEPFKKIKKQEEETKAIDCDLGYEIMVGEDIAYE